MEELIIRFFNYEKCYILSGGNPTNLIKFFKQLNEGYDFIVNEDVVESPFISDLHKAEYLGLCALRNYENFLSKEEVDVDLDLVPPWIPIEHISQNNPLITLTDKKIILKREK